MAKTTRKTFSKSPNQEVKAESIEKTGHGKKAITGDDLGRKKGK